MRIYDRIDGNTKIRQTSSLVASTTFRDRKGASMKKSVKKLGLHVETLRNLEGPCIAHINGGARTDAPGTVCTTCTNVCSFCHPCF